MILDATRAKSVLVVDDEAAIRRIVRRILERHRYHIVECSNGVEALARLAADARFDLVVTDVRMPELRGDEMVRRIRVARPNLKVLYVSGFVGSQIEQRPVLSEGEAFLDKPFTSDELIAAVRRLIGPSRSPSE